MSAPGKPVSILVAALGGEGGGVLTGWVVSAAEALGLPVQSTSIPGVAQRTGATSYYIEIVPTPWRELGERRPVLALAPGVGDIDILLASELMEAGRVIAAGFVTASQTLTIASTSRCYVVDEKIAMGDGRYDAPRLIRAIEEQSQQSILFDMDEIARRTAAVVNAVMLGAIAGCGRLPLPADALEAAIRADGKAVEANLRGFHAGLEAARQTNAAAPSSGKRRCRTVPSLADLEREIVSVMPPAARDIIIEGARRLYGYQHLDYARLYLDRLSALRRADERAGAGGRLLRETARHLAVRMSYEDVIRVAQAKIDPARLKRIAAEIGARPGEPVAVTEFLKPGVEEFAAILPAGLAAMVLRLAKPRWLRRAHWGMAVNTASVTGFLSLWLLARLRRFRPRSYRFREQQRAIEAWLALIIEAAPLSANLAGEIAECARLIKGYGDTLKRGSANYQQIEEQLIRPALAGHIPVRRAIDALASARSAALADPDGESLKRCLAAVTGAAACRQAAE